MTSQAVTPQGKSELLEQVVIGGDLAQLTPQQRVEYYRSVCQSLGINPLTRPFSYITLNGKLTLYATKDAADQLRAIHGVSIDDIETSETEKQFIVKAKGHDKTGRADVELGVVNKADMRGDAANAQMKAVTKAKRRLTLSLVGLGWLDETEVETIKDAAPIAVTDTGEIIDGKVDPPKRAAPAKTTPAAPSTGSVTWDAYWKEIKGPLGLTTKDGNAFLEEVGATLGGAPDSALLSKALELARASRK